MRDPIQWSARAVGSTTRFVIMVLSQIIGAAFIIAMHCYHNPFNPFSALMVIFFCVWMPSLTLYALRKVLNELRRVQESREVVEMRTPPLPQP
jgi:hypothetical protein